MARIAVGGLHHETNTFSPQLATFDRFAEADGWPELLRGPTLLERPRGINLPLAGFLHAARAAGHAPVPLVWANAGPSGPVTRDAFERIATWLLDDLAASLPVDAVYLDLHGAMVTEHLDDGEGELLRRVRALVGADLPIVASLDLHANVSAEMVAACDAMLAFRTYPHIDMAVTGARCLPLIGRLLSGRRMAKAWRQLDFMVPLPWQASTIEPGRSLYALLAVLEQRHAATLSLAMGFPAADVPCCGPSILAYADDPAAADAAAEALAGAYALAEPQFAGRLWSPDDAVAEARRQPRGQGPLIIADTQDNPGGGGTGDSTGLLAALIAAAAPNAALGLLIDPVAAAAAHAAGTGAVLERFALGGRYGPPPVEPCIDDWQVAALADGRFLATGPFYGGNRMELGPMAALRPRRAPGATVLVATQRIQAADQAMFRHLAIEPATLDILGLKSSVHFRADFEPIAQRVLVCRSPGYVVADPAELAFERLRPGLRRHPMAAEQ